MKRPPIYKPKRFQQGGPVLTQDDVEDNLVMIQKLQELGIPSRDIRNIMRLPLESRLQAIDSILRIRADASAGIVPQQQRTATNTLASRNIRAQQQREQQAAAQQARTPSSSLPLPPEPPSSPPSSLPIPPPMPARAARREAARENVSADDLNARVLRLTRGGAPQDEVDRRLAERMGLTFAKGGLVRGKHRSKKC